MNEIPFLNYHNIQPAGDPYTISENSFKAQMDLLNELGFSTLSVDEFLSLRNAEERRENNLISITFDDGYSSNYEICLPVLKKYGFKATFFITTGWIDSEIGFSAKQIDDMAKRGMQIGSHTVNHVFLPNVSDEVLYYELKDSKRRLEEIINDEVTCLSLPGGRNIKKITEVAKEIGYKSICTSEYRMNNFDSDPFSLGRIAIKSTFSLELFGKIVTGNHPTWRSMKFKQHIKYIVQRILGSKLYHSLWEMKYE